MSNLKDLKDQINRKSNYRFEDELNELYSNDFKTLIRLLGKSDDIDVEAFTQESMIDDELVITKGIKVTNKFKSEFIIRFDKDDNVC